MYMTSVDVPVLLGRKFTFGITEDFLWGKDKQGRKYQAHVDGEYIYFTDCTGMARGERMTMKQADFYENFPGI